MSVALSLLQQRIISEIGRTVSTGEGVVASSAMKIISAHAGSADGGFLLLSAADIERMFILRGTRDVTKARQMSTLWRIFDVAQRWGLVSTNPVDSVCRPKIERKEPDFDVDNAIIDALIAHCGNAVATAHSSARRERLLLRLAILYVVTFGGFLSEVEGILAHDLSSDGLIVSRDTKRERKLRISQDGVAALRDYRCSRKFNHKMATPELLFANELGEALEIKLVWRHLRNVIKAAGFADEGLTPAKLHRGPVRAIADGHLGWEPAIVAGGYSHIPAARTIRYAPDELALYIDRFHPMSS